MSSNVGRRDPCPCGSGKKYKNCCGQQGTKSSSGKWTGFKSGVLAIVIIGGGIAAYMTFSKPTKVPTESILPRAPRSVQPLQSQPPGSAPEGKVWSEEHGHWHDSTGSASDFATEFTPQPPGPAPDGKVWSSECGHWHDASGAAMSSGSGANPISITPGATTPSGSGTNPISITPSGTPKSSGELTPQPPGPPPEGKVWSAEHGHWHNEPGTSSGTSSGEFTPQPPGPPPEGKVWAPEHGHWHNAPGAATPSGSGTSPITITPAKPPETGSEDPE